MNDEIERLVQRWIIAFREVPILIDVELLRAVLADVEDRQEAPTP